MIVAHRIVAEVDQKEIHIHMDKADIVTGKYKQVSRTSDRQKTSKLGRIGILLQSVLAEVLCLHRGVVKKEVAVLCREKEECCGSLPGEGRVLRFSAGRRKSVAVLCREKEECCGSLPEEGRGFSAITKEWIILGSVTNYVVSNAVCPITVIKDQDFKH
ncbi:hypothetical protein M5K25_013742 [Dendrobium thyrsiflorum]|uniref:Uncharacterized protein n=1 Tax=Dendrobium thyrsiflorum TaxID=117978 RepID=A0ABD0UTM2_DENTH